MVIKAATSGAIGTSSVLTTGDGSIGECKRQHQAGEDAAERRPARSVMFCNGAILRQTLNLARECAKRSCVM
jgi:hypothetical protein